MGALEDYEKVKRIGDGGQAEVWLAVQRSFGRKVVLKVLHERDADDERLVGRFLRGARAVSHLSHENIVTLHDLGGEGARPFIAMEYIDGWDLKGWVHEHGIPPMEVGLLLGLDLCRGLQHAHEHGVIHRDVKPANLMISKDGILKLTDFELARPALHLDMTVPGTLIGTVLYMSPEQAAGQHVDERADLFSAGTVLFELLSGRHPFKPGEEETSITTMLGAIMSPNPPPRLESLNPLLPPEVVSTVHRMIEKDPERRHTNMSAARSELETALEGLHLWRPRDLTRSYFTDPAAMRETLRRKHLKRHLEQGIYLETLGQSRISEAEREFRRVLHLDPANETAREHLQQLAGQLGHPLEDADLERTLVYPGPGAGTPPPAPTVPSAPAPPVPASATPPAPPAAAPPVRPAAPSPAERPAPRVMPPPLAPAAAPPSPAPAPTTPPAPPEARGPARPPAPAPRAAAPPPASPASTRRPAGPSRSSGTRPIGFAIAGVGVLLVAALAVMFLQLRGGGRERPGETPTAGGAVTPMDPVEGAPAGVQGRSGAIAITTEPPGARVLVDGTAAPSLSPVTVAELEPGEHTVQAVLQGHAPLERKVSVVAGDTSRLRLALEARPAGEPGILVVSGAPGTSYRVDGRGVPRPADGRLELAVEPGTHRVMAIEPGGDTLRWSKVQVRSKETTTLALASATRTSLGQRRTERPRPAQPSSTAATAPPAAGMGTLVVELDRGAAATVYMDNRDMGKTPARIPDARPGPRRLRLVRLGYSYAPAETTVEVRAGQTTVVRFRRR